MQLLDEHLWRLYEAGKITLEEMLDKARQPGVLQDRAMSRMGAGKVKGKPSTQQMEEDIGPILRT